MSPAEATRGAGRVVAIDGPAGAGKSSVARLLASRLGYAHLDTGAMYRAVALAALEGGVSADDPSGLAVLARSLPLSVDGGGRVRLGAREVTHLLRSDAVNACVSRVASVPEVRAEMVRHQRAFAAAAGNVVAEGRDMSSVVFPDACVKVYLDADPVERARRRLAEEGRGQTPEDLALAQAGLSHRDQTDRGRAVSPLTQAPDAWYLDTTGLTLEQVVDRVLLRVRSTACPADGR